MLAHHFVFVQLKQTWVSTHHHPGEVPCFDRLLQWRRAVSVRSQQALDPRSNTLKHIT
jgi:hypothetical protein